MGRIEFVKVEMLKASLKTPTLCNVTRTAPDMHYGILETMNTEKADLIEFLNAPPEEEAPAIAPIIPH